MSFLPDFYRVHFVWLCTQMPSSQEALLAVTLSKITTFSFLHFPALFYFSAHTVTQYIIYIIYIVYCLSPLAELKLNKGRDLFFIFSFFFSLCPQRLIEPEDWKPLAQKRGCRGPFPLPPHVTGTRPLHPPLPRRRESLFFFFMFYIFST